jgi:hypothetical protein
MTTATADSSAALRNDNKRTGNDKDKDDSRSPSGMTTRKTNARAKAKYWGLSTAHQTMKLSDASVEMTFSCGPLGMTTRKTTATAKAKR